MILIKKTVKKKKNFLIFNKFLYIYFFSSILIVLIFIIFLFTSTLVKTNVSKFLDHFSKAGRFEYIYILDIGLKAIKSNFYKIKKINLDINFEKILIIENHRAKSIKNGSLGNSEKIPVVNGEASIDGQTYKVKIRLKGERKIHFNQKENSSYKIDLKKDNYILGMNNFSIQKPRVRNYVYEWLFHELAEDFGLIKMQYKFVELTINGSNQGLYVMQESFGKEMVERNKRRNGPIFAFDDNMINFSTNFKVNENDPFFEIYDKKYWYQKENYTLVKAASKKLRSFINGNISLEETFDLEKFAKFFAIIDATYTFHALSPGTLRLYYNPINGLFEPIPFDGQRAVPNYSKYNLNYDNSILIDYVNKGGWWIDKFFLKDNKINKNFYNKYVDNLKKISSIEYLDTFFKERDNQINKINSFIYSDYFFYANGSDFGPGIYYYKKNDLIHRSQILQKRISSTNRDVQIIKNKNNDYVVKIYFKHCFKCKPYTNLIKIFAKEIICSKNMINKTDILVVPVNKQLNFERDTLIKKNNELKNLNCTHFNFYDQGKKEYFSKKIDDLNSHQELNIFQNFDFDLYRKYFININNELFLKNNFTIIDKNLFIPENLKVKIKKGQKITLVDNAFIFSRSPWIAVGDKNSKIIIGGIKENFGGGLIIQDTEKNSFFKNVKFQFLDGLEKESYNKINQSFYISKTYYSDGQKNNFKKKIIKEKALINDFNLMGSVNFYNTSVTLEDVSFEKISSEDAINIISSKFYINNINFSENGSDSIDFDFSKGTIENANFKNVGNDAVDFSGSNVKLHNASFFDIGDKIISVGENSNVNISEIIAKKSFVGIAAKDGSKVLAENITMNNVKIPFSSFIKKSEYDNPTLVLKNIQVSDYLEKWMTDKKSEIYFNDIKVGKVSKDIIPVIYEKNIELIK
jgi:hypothetical protein